MYDRLDLLPLFPRTRPIFFIPKFNNGAKDIEFSAELMQDTEQRGGSERIDVALCFQTRREAILFATQLREAAESLPERKKRA